MGLTRDVPIEISDLNNRWNKMALEESAKRNQILRQQPAHQGSTPQQASGGAQLLGYLVNLFIPTKAKR